VASRSPRCIVIAGPNGAGKTTFARTYRALADRWSVYDNR
jgi:predicted ABC-type ATPase